MEKTKLLTIAVIGLLLLNLGTLLYLVLRPAEQPAWHGPPPHRRPDALIIGTLKLDEAQQARFEELKHAHRSEANQIEDQRVELQHELFALLKEPQPDTVKARALTAQIGRLQEQMVQLNFRHFLEIREMLRPEQLPLYAELTRKMAHFFGPPPRPPH